MFTSIRSRDISLLEVSLFCIKYKEYAITSKHLLCLCLDEAVLVASVHTDAKKTLWVTPTAWPLHIEALCRGIYRNSQHASTYCDLFYPCDRRRGLA